VARAELIEVASSGRVDRAASAGARRMRPVAATRRSAGGRPEKSDAVRRLVAGRRALAFVLCALIVTTTGYVVSTATTVFSVRTIEVSGADPGLAADVRAALEPAKGTSLVGIDLDELAALVRRIPAVAGVSFDRAFPHRLAVTVVPERAVGVVRQGKAAYVVSARGRVVEQIARTEQPELPRIWAAKTEALVTGADVPRDILPAVRAVSPLHRVGFPARIAAVRTSDDAISLRLRSGFEVRLGTPQDMLLKLTVAGNVLPQVGSETTYLDVSVPERPVAGDDRFVAAVDVPQSVVPVVENPVIDSEAQLEVEPATSTTP
jgi:cell division protein FtsQ